jgi:hypothetical protein
MGVDSMRSAQRIRHWLFGLAGMVVMGMATSARADADTLERYVLYAGLHLNFAEAQLRILYSGLSPKTFDGDITEQVLKGIQLSLEEAERSLGRAEMKLDAKHAKWTPKLRELREDIAAASEQLRVLATDVDEQTNGSGESEGEDALEKAAASEGRDFDLLRTTAGWLYEDLTKAEKNYAGVVKTLKLSPPDPPKRPKGTRPGT